MDAGRGLLGHALDRGEALAVPTGLRGDATLDGGEKDALLLASGFVENGDVGLGAGTEVEKQGGVPTVVEDHVRVPAVGPLEDLVGELPVLLERFALVGKNGNTGRGDGGGGVILGREDVARGPANLGTESLERLDQDGRLDGHVQAAGDAGALERLLGGELFADGHQAGHFGFGDGQLAAAPGGEREIRDVVVAETGGLLRNGSHVQSLLNNERAPLRGSNPPQRAWLVRPCVPSQRPSTRWLLAYRLWARPR